MVKLVQKMGSAEGGVSANSRKPTGGEGGGHINLLAHFRKDTPEGGHTRKHRLPAEGGNLPGKTEISEGVLEKKAGGVSKSKSPRC